MISYPRFKLNTSVNFEDCLESILRFIGLLVSYQQGSNGISLRNRCRACFIITLSCLNALYEIVNIENNVALKSHNGKAYVGFTFQVFKLYKQ